VPAPILEPALGLVVGTFDTSFLTLLGALDGDGRLVRVVPVQGPLAFPATRVFTQGVMFSPADGFVPTPPRSTAILAAQP
jgi:hypothetical protein